MKINELDYKEIGRMLSDGYYDIFDKYDKSKFSKWY